jgi:hypothetical protein
MRIVMPQEINRKTTKRDVWAGIVVGAIAAIVCYLCMAIGVG